MKMTWFSVIKYIFRVNIENKNENLTKIEVTGTIVYGNRIQKTWGWGGRLL